MSVAAVPRRRFDVGTVLYLALALMGWAAATVLTAAGLFVALFLMAGNGSLGGFFEQVDLLASHYLAADATRRASFDGQAAVAGAVVFGATGFFRRGALVAIFKRGGVIGPRRTTVA